MSLQRPIAALRPFIEALWATDAAPDGVACREHVLPSGRMHLAIRLGDAPMRLFRDANDPAGERMHPASVCGARTGFYIKQAAPVPSVGVLLRPGAAQALLGCDADELGARHVALDDLWSGHEAARLLEQLHAQPDARARADALQHALREHLRPVRAMHPAIAQAMQRLDAGEVQVREIVAASGCSHRHLIARFRAATGFAPKEYARVKRFRRALRLMAAAHPLDGVALDAGYSDQSHFNREFRALAGITPREYLAAPVRGRLHVHRVNFVQDAPAPAD